MIALDDHVHTLHDISLGIFLEGDDALEAQNVRSLRLGDLLDPGEEALRVHLAAAQRNGLHCHVMDGRHRSVMMVMMIVVVMVVVVMIAIRAADVIVMAVLEEMR